MSNQLVPVPFHDDNVLSIEKEGVVYFTPKSVCNNLGLNWSAQLQRIKRDDMLNSTVVMITTVAKDGRDRETVCLPLKYMASWLTSINSKRVKPEIRDALLAYKLECADALDAYWNKGEAINPRAAQNEAPRLETIIEAVKLAKELYGVAGAKAVWEKHGMETGHEIDQTPTLPPAGAAHRMVVVENIFVRLLRYSIISNEFVHRDIASGNWAPEIFSIQTGGRITVREFELTMDNLLNKRTIKANSCGNLEFSRDIPWTTR